jgi:protein-S-isoprenylcysteine O-methyltransferase Ste14
MLYIKTFIGIIFQVSLLALFLLLPAPTWYWYDAIFWSGFYFLINVITSFWICAYYPASMEARLEFNFKRQPRKDKIATSIIILAIALALNFITVDVFYLHIFEAPTPMAKYLGLAISVIGYTIILFTIVQNEFAQSVVNIQDERNQMLVDTGLYSYVRHPMYTGFMFFFAGIGLWLDSIFMATIGTIILMLAFIPRILIEEETLSGELNGYAAYLQRVKYRIIPKVY